MKYLKIFEEYNRKELVIKPILNKKIGDIVDESDIYSYVEALHHTNDDFFDGNLGDRIEWYPKYQLKEVMLSELNLDEHYWDESEVEEFKTKFLHSGKYPPIVLAHDYSIIDGTHRANSLEQVGEKNILAFVGIGNEEIFDPFADY